MIRIGDRVRIDYSNDELLRLPYAKTLNGREYIVADIVQLNRRDMDGRLQQQKYYTLHDCMSKTGIGYSFTIDQLVKVANK